MKLKEILKISGLVMHQTEGKGGLRFVCQICDKFIEDADLGLFVWNPTDRKSVV